MKFSDIATFSLDQLMHRGLRSWLTILGVVIGVAAVVAIISIGTGTQQLITNQLGGLGANIISISSGSSRAFNFGGPEAGQRAAILSSLIPGSGNLTQKDIQTIRSVPSVQYVDGIVSGRVEVTYLSQTTSLQIQGVDPLAWSQMTTSELESGRFLTPSDGNAIVIGYSVANDVFKQQLAINNQLNVGGKPFKIVGILQQSGGFGGSDNAVIMPVSAARSIITDVAPNQFNSIQVNVADSSQVNETTNSINQRLLVARHVTEDTKDFSVTSAQSLQETISTVTGTLSIFLTGIAAISLLVGAIGISNTMFMSVLERTKQIGVLKALGTTNREITQMFLTEASIMGFIGGLLGIFLGFIASGAVSELGSRLITTGVRGGSAAGITAITPDLVLFSMVFSIVIGAISGLLPARRASKLDPVEALRYE